MKPRLAHQRTVALTLVEVLVVIAVLFAVLICASLPHLRVLVKQQNCYSNLRAGGVAFWMWADDHNNKMPMELSTNDGGSKEWVMQGNVAETFRLMSNTIDNPMILTCPADTRTWATNWSQFDNQHLSYFVGVDATYNTNFSDASMSRFLFGDRNLTNENGIGEKILQLTASQSVGWTREMHENRGNICLANGMVLKLNNSYLRVAIQSTGLATNRLAIP